MAIALLFQSIPETLILQVGELDTAKEIWDAVKTRHVGAERVKEARLQTLTAEFDRLKMKDSETIDDFAGKISEISSKSAALGANMEAPKLVKKFLKSLPRKKYIHIVASLEQVLDLNTTSFEDIVGRLKAYEERILEDDEETQDDQGKLMYTEAPTTQYRDSRSDFRGRGRGGRSSFRGGGRGRYIDGRDTSKVICYRCDKMGHFASNCPDRLLKLQEAQVTENFDTQSAHELMMHEVVYLNEKHCKLSDYETNTGEENIWYLDNGASNHMTGDGVKRESSSDDDDDVSSEFDFQKHRKKGSFNREPDIENQSLSPVSESPNDYGKITPRAAAATHMSKVSFKESELVHRRASDEGQIPNRNSNVSFKDDHVLRCTSNASFQEKGKSGLMRMKTKSRLMDPPQANEKRSGRVENRSGMIGRSTEIEEDDPFDEDLPDEYKKGKLSCFTLIQWASLILIIAALVCNFAIKKLKGVTVWGMELWKWEVMVLVLICGGLVSGWLIKIVVFFIERNFLLRKRVLYFVYGLRSSVQKFLWLGWVLLAWILILDKKVEKETKSQVLPYVTKILVCFMVATLVWLVKTLLLKVLAMNFHVSAFFDRIQDALFNQYVIETLSGPPSLELLRIQEEEDRLMGEVKKLQNAGAHIPADIRANCLPNEGRMFGSGRSTASGLPPKSPVTGKTPRSSFVGKSPRFAKSPSNKREEEGENAGISIDQLHRFNQKNISAWNMKRLMNIVRKGVLSTLDEQLDSGVEDDDALQIRSEKEAKAAAKRVFTNVARPNSRHIYLEDLMRFLREDEASRTMRLFEGAGDGKGINKRALKNWMVNVFRERRALALSLNDTKTAVNKLHHLVNILVGIVVIIIWLLILGVPVTHFLVFVSSQVVVLAFMFGNTCKTTFEAIIFLFVMHPFDVGDRCEIEGVQMVVEEMNILTTVFLRFDNQKIIYPNSVLATKSIGNYYRSPEMGDAIDFCVHISTPVEKLSLMKERITRYIENKKEHWFTGPMIVMRDVEDMNRIKFSIWLSHTINHQDMGERWVRRALLVEEMVRIFRDLDVEYRMLPMDVNVRNMQPLVSDRLPSNWTTCSR